MSFLAYLGLGLLGCLLGGPFMGGVHAQKCPRGWLEDEGFRYCYSPKRVNWTEAERQCASLGLRFASMDCYRVPEKIVQYLKRLGVKSNVWLESGTFQESWSMQPIQYNLQLVKSEGFSECVPAPIHEKLPALCMAKVGVKQRRSVEDTPVTDVDDEQALEPVDVGSVADAEERHKVEHLSPVDDHQEDAEEGERVEGCARPLEEKPVAPHRAIPVMPRPVESEDLE